MINKLSVSAIAIALLSITSSASCLAAEPQDPKATTPIAESPSPAVTPTPSQDGAKKVHHKKKDGVQQQQAPATK